MGRIVNIDGQLLPPEQAVVPVFDRGFLYGDSVYEVMRTYGGVPFEMDAHLARLARSAELIGLLLPRTPAQLAREIDRTVAAAGNPESYARIIVTRGAGEIGLDPALGTHPRTIVIVRELSPPPPEAYQLGVLVALVGVQRNLPKAIDPQAKTGNYLNNVLAVREATALGAYEAILLDHEGRVTEGANSNVFAVRTGRLATPALEVGVLPGVTRRVVLELARAERLPVDERPMVPSDLTCAEEVFITSTTRELVPVVRIVQGEQTWKIGQGAVGPLTKRLLASFRARAAGTVRR